MYLVVINNSTDSGTAKGFQVRRNSFTGRLCLTVKPPHFGPCGILRNRKARGQLAHCPRTDTPYRTASRKSTKKGNQ